MTDDIPDEAAGLYEERPDAFVAARNALAKSLRGEGRRDEAKVVAALRRPSVASWALNKVARQQPKLVDEALASGAALQSTTQRAVAGKKVDLRAAQEAQRAALDSVVDAALVALKDLGAGNLDQLRTRATNTLHAAMADEEVAGRLRTGTLDEDVDAPGFGFGFGAFAAEETDADADHDADEDERDGAAARATAERDALDAEIERRRTLADDLAEKAAAAEAAASTARAAADDAAASLAEAQATRAARD